MAELVPTMVIRPLVAMLRDKASSYLLDQYNVMEGMEEQHRILKRRLPIIFDIITDIEQATVHREGPKAWLEELKTVAYEANEVFDEFKYEALRREAKKNGHYKKLGFDVIKLFPTHNRVVFRHRMGSKLYRILQDINVLIAEMHDFGLRQTLLASKQLRQTPVSKEWRHTGHVFIDPQEIASRSREKNKDEIVHTLLRQASNANLAVVHIIGMGGLGKTTLAQLIYNEPKIQNHFPLLLWVCVSDTFDVNSLAKCIVEASPKKNDDTNKPPLDRLQKLVSEQRYLLVLDDVWNREVQKWEKLKASLQHGDTGSAVLTTTRDKQIAEIMGADGASYHLSHLEDRFLKEIIEARAFISEKKKPTELVMMVDKIVKRCCGYPLAASALGSVLRTKTSVKEWKNVSSRSRICIEETGILPILQLCYNELPSHLKECFAFCALFPKNYKIDVKKLIQLWIANGLIPEHKEDSLETSGNHIFNELASRSFFLDIEESKDFRGYYSTTCKIHDLMHAIAMSVMNKLSVVATEKPSQIECLPDTTRHLFLSRGETEGRFFSREETEGISNESLQKRFPVIRTLICDNFTGSSLKHLSKYKSLRALKLHIGRESFLPKPKYLRYLRYLDLSNSYIKALPEDISILYNLQMLDLSNCFHLGRLPRLMKYMTSLRHLYTHGCPNLKSMPPELGKLTKLQTLTCFVAAAPGPDCSDVAELQLLNLGGRLELCQVENVAQAEKKVANLGKKMDLRELTLSWTYVCDSRVLDSFEPHDALQVLRIYSYGGRCITMLQNMVEIHLFHCEKMQFLFRCDPYFTFPKLKELTLEHLLDLEGWWETNERQEEEIMFPLLEKLFIRHCRKLVAFPKAPLLFIGNYGDDGLVRSPFPALKVLELENLESFQRWDSVKEIQGEPIWFPHLKKLLVQRCPKLIDLPEAPELSALEIEDGKQEMSHWVDRYLSSLTNLILKLEYTETTSEVECTSIVPVHSKEKWNQKSPLIVLELECCNSLFGSGAVETWDYFVHLKDMEIDRCDGLIHWPEKVFQSLVSLRRLTIRRCENLTGYAQSPLGPSSSGRSQHLPGLEVLQLHDCASLVEMFNVPASLKRMTIYECCKLESILGKQQSMSELVEGPSCSEAIMPTTISESSSSPMNHFCPCLESLWLTNCEGLSAVLSLPPSLKTINIAGCSSIQVLSCQLDGLPKPQVSTSINVPEPPATSAREHSLPPFLVSLTIISCAGMLGAVLRLPPSLRKLDIRFNNGLMSLESLSTEYPPSLESLVLNSCSTLASLPNEPEAYRCLQELIIRGCPAIKELPACLMQQLGCISDRYNAHHYEVTEFKPLKPKTWKEIPSLVRERRQGTREATQRQQSNRAEAI